VRESLRSATGPLSAKKWVGGEKNKEQNVEK